jgi:hypothetical protein
MTPRADNVLELDFQRGGAQPREETAEQTIARIDRNIKSNYPVIEVYRIDPVVAEHILKTYNHGNRTKKPSMINRYARDMVADKWEMTFELLKFSDQGIMRDGQNRLFGCIKAQKSFLAHIAFGVPDKAFTKMDQGKNRSGGDLLQMAGYTNTSNLAAAVRWVHLFETGRVRQRDTFDPPMILELVQTRYTDLPELMTQAGRIYKITGTPHGLAAALMRQFRKANPIKAAAWGEGWEKGKDADAFKPLDLVGRRVAEIKKASQGPIQDIVRAALLVQAWNLYVYGRKGRREDIGWTTDEEFPAILG